MSNLMLSLEPTHFITYLILILFEMVICTLAIVGALIADNIVKQGSEEAIKIGVIGGVIVELVWRIFTSGKFPGLMDNMFVGLCGGLLAVLVVGPILGKVLSRK